MSRTIAWIDGHWGEPMALGVPLSDRGLHLADGVFETVLLCNGRPQLLRAHHQRWCAGAAVLGMAAPPSIDTLQPLIQEAAKRCGIGLDASPSHGALRLNWSRDGAGSRGIQVPPGAPDPAQHRFWFSLAPHTPRFAAVRTWISRHEQRNANSQLSHCKTFAYGQAIQARREALSQGAEEGLLRSTTGELCCASTANLLVRRQGRWLTPPLGSGCLPGIMRQRLLDQGVAREHRLETEPEPEDQWLLINSLDCRPVSAIDGQPLKISADAADLWTSLLQNTD